MKIPPSPLLESDRSELESRLAHPGILWLSAPRGAGASVLLTRLAGTLEPFKVLGGFTRPEVHTYVIGSVPHYEIIGNVLRDRPRVLQLILPVPQLGVGLRLIQEAAKTCSVVVRCHAGQDYIITQNPRDSAYVRLQANGTNHLRLKGMTHAEANVLARDHGVTGGMWLEQVVNEVGGLPLLVRRVVNACAPRGGPISLSELCDHRRGPLNNWFKELADLIVAAGAPRQLSLKAASGDVLRLLLEAGVLTWQSQSPQRVLVNIPVFERLAESAGIVIRG